MNKQSALSLLRDTLPYRDFDTKIFVGMRCNYQDSCATIVEIQPSPKGTKFKVLFDENSSLGSVVPKYSLIEWPTHLDISIPDICTILMSPVIVPSDSKKTGWEIFAESAQIEAIVDNYYGRYEGAPERSIKILEEFDIYDHEDHAKRQAEERSEYNDSASRAHEDGWFHSDSDN